MKPASIHGASFRFLRKFVTLVACELLACSFLLLPCLQSGLEFREKI